ncbi:hypothetical protein GCM10023263_45090 [Phytohabitans rumicis]
MTLVLPSLAGAWGESDDPHAAASNSVDAATDVTKDLRMGPPNGVCVIRTIVLMKNVGGDLTHVNRLVDSDPGAAVAFG